MKVKRMEPQVTGQAPACTPYNLTVGAKKFFIAFQKHTQNDHFHDTHMRVYRIHDQLV